MQRALYYRTIGTRSPFGFAVVERRARVRPLGMASADPTPRAMQSKYGGPHWTVGGAGQHDAAHVAVVRELRAGADDGLWRPCARRSTAHYRSTPVVFAQCSMNCELYSTTSAHAAADNPAAKAMAHRQ
jgi:hypothetical protein